MERVQAVNIKVQELKVARIVLKIVIDKRKWEQEKEFTRKMNKIIEEALPKIKGFEETSEVIIYFE